MKIQTTSAFLITLALLCFLLPNAQAVSPAPDGGYSGDNTAEGTQALQSLTTGVWNSAFGFRSLFKIQPASEIQLSAIKRCTTPTA